MASIGWNVKQVGGCAHSRCWPFDNVAHLNSDTKGRSSRRLPAGDTSATKHSPRIVRSRLITNTYLIPAWSKFIAKIFGNVRTALSREFALCVGVRLISNLFEYIYFLSTYAIISFYWIRDANSSVILISP